MDEQRVRLLSCFRAVFGDLPEGQLLGASTSTLPQWDSVISITLVNVIEEEFEMQFDYDLIAELNSFDALLKQVSSAKGADV